MRGDNRKFHPPENGAQRRNQSAAPSDGGNDFRAKLLAEATETNRLLRRIDLGISALLKSSPGADLYDDIFNDEKKSAADRRALLDRQHGMALDRLTDEQAQELSMRLPPALKAAFDRSGKHVVKYPLMELLQEDAGEHS